MDRKIRVGTLVEWKSQSSAYASVKKGAVVAVIPAGEFPCTFPEKEIKYRPEYFDYDDYRLAKLGGGLSRNHESYLVSVLPEKGNGKPYLYWPRVSGLKVVSMFLVKSGGRT